jgi:hypothetical protein
MGFLRRHSVNLALALLALAGLIVVALTTGRTTTAERDARRANVLGIWQEDAVSAVTVERASERVVLERSAPDATGTIVWHLRAPLSERAEPAAVDRLLGALRFATFIRRVDDEGLEPAALGLDKPRVTLRVTMGEMSYELALGRTLGDQKSPSYLRVGGRGALRSGVFVVSPEVAQSLDIQLSDLRVRQLIELGAESTARVSLSQGARQTVFSRQPSGEWRLGGAFGPLRVNPLEIERLFVSLARIETDRFIEVRAAEQALETAKPVELVLEPAAETRKAVRVRIGGECPSAPELAVAVRTEPTPLGACVSRPVLDALTRPARELVDTRLFAAPSDAIESVVLKSADRTLDIARSGDGFVLRQPERLAVSLEAGEPWLENLLGATGELHPDTDRWSAAPAPAELSALGLGESAGSATISMAAATEAAAEQETVLVGVPRRDGTVYVQRRQDGAVLRLGPETARALRPDAAPLRSTAPWTLEQKSIDSLAVRFAGIEQRLRKNAHGSFDLEAPPGYSADAGLVDDLLSAVASLEVAHWVADRDDGSFGLARPTLVVKAEATTAQGERGDRELRVGARTASGAYASVSDTGGVFVLPRRTLDRLMTLVVDRSVFMLDSEKAQRVVLETRERRVALVRHGKEWTSEHDALSSEKVHRVIELLETLRPEAAVQLGTHQPEHGLEQPLLRVQVDSGTRDASRRFRIGAGDSWRGLSVHYARADQIDATYALPRGQVQALLELL